MHSIPLLFCYNTLLAQNRYTFFFNKESLESLTPTFYLIDETQIQL